MKLPSLDFKNFETDSSKFNASLSNTGGYVVFSNSGQRDSKKYFSLGLTSFYNCLLDIRNNLAEFKRHQDYEEKAWRDLAGMYYNDQPALAQATVQTKPMFATMSKIIMWANNLNLSDKDPESKIFLTEESINNTIEKLAELIEYYTPLPIKKIPFEKIEFSNKSFREFAFLVFKKFYGDDFSQIIDFAEESDARIGEVSYTSLNFDVFKRIIGVFNSYQTKESLTSSNTLRFFESPITTKNNKIYYFSTQWNGEGNYSLSFDNLKSFVSKTFKDYQVQNRNGEYFLIKITKINPEDFKLKKFISNLSDSCLKIEYFLSLRFCASLLTKRFIILTGLSGSGKTKLAQAFAEWISEDDDQIALIPVGADWTNREPLLGYVNGLGEDKYVKPESGALDLILRANSNPNKPYFLILDEMNLSHVERYFADFLSVMESGSQIKLHSSETEMSGVPPMLSLPKNLFIIGTVNIDETTYMFSPKVLDRANVIEFRVNDSEIAAFLDEPKIVEMKALRYKGATMGAHYIELSNNKEFENKDSEVISKVLVSFFKSLSEIGAEFGYRSASEIIRLINQLKVLEPEISTDDCLDIAIMQKLLPKLHGSRRKLVSVLKVLAQLCVEKEEIKDIEKDVLTKSDFNLLDRQVVNYPISLEKIKRMYKNAIEHGFASYAEA